jgi:hypothetical protein
MQSNVSEKALRILRSARNQPTTNDGLAPGSVIERKRREVLERTNPNVVAESTWKFWTPEARYRKLAKNDALETRLTAFRDGAQTVLTANKVMNHAALIAVMTAAERFIVEIRAICEVEKQALLEASQIDLLSSLRLHLSEVEILREQGGIPDAILDQRFEDALNQYAERSIKIAGLGFEFDKSSLLKLNPQTVSTQDGAR